jgi:hypothetical protein
LAAIWPGAGRFRETSSALIAGQEMQPYRLASTVKPSAFLRLFSAKVSGRSIQLGIGIFFSQ